MRLMVADMRLRSDKPMPMPSAVSAIHDITG
jgi:hypothetical protein